MVPQVVQNQREEQKIVTSSAVAVSTDVSVVDLEEEEAMDQLISYVTIGPDTEAKRQLRWFGDQVSGGFEDLPEFYKEFYHKVNSIEDLILLAEFIFNSPGQQQNQGPQR